MFDRCINGGIKMNEDYMSSFELIAIAGTSQSMSFQAIAAAREGDHEKAEEFLTQAKDAMTQAHEKQFQMLQDEANGKPVPNHIVMIHAQDHLTMAKILTDMAEELNGLYKRLEALENK